MKKKDLFKRRIAGLTSYYGYLDPKFFPKITSTNLLSIPMSYYQQTVYETVRHEEITKEKQQRKKRADEQLPGTFRIHSRFACSIAFPEELTGAEKEELLEQLMIMEDGRTISEEGDALKDVGTDPTIIEETLDTEIQEVEETEADLRKKKKELDALLKSKIATFFRREKSKYLDIANGSLAKYSPKYLEIIKNLVRSPGSALIYSQFRTLQGLYILSLALEQTGEYAPFVINKVNKEWVLDETNWDPSKKRFIFYSGLENKEISQIYIKIFNSQWNELDSSCDNLIANLRSKFGDEANLYGKVINLFMTTKKGAEGIDLKHVRQVHIMEPYWQPVLMNQVIGRAVRTNSHIKLPEKDRTVEAFIYMATLTPALVRKISYVDVRNDVYKYPNPAFPDKANKVVSSDEHLFLTAERKRYIINEFQRLMKESAFDCLLNYRDNKLNPDYKGITCMDYSTKNRDDYLATPMLEDEGLEIAPERVVAVKYGTIEYKGKKFFFEMTPSAMGKMYIYDENLVGRVRMPKPVGEVIMRDGKRQFAFYAKKVKNAKKK